MRYLDEKRKARIEIIPMIDIMFFLLVFFIMLTLRMIPASGIGSRLPHSSTAEQLPHPVHTVTLQEDGSVKLDNQDMSLEALSQQLGADPDKAKAVVTIVGAAKATVQEMLAVMDACRKAGITQIGIAARAEDGN
jgi:biopolymer transport protein ExbD